jgi:tetratricopeptide (TPR) repeat protein
LKRSAAFFWSFADLFKRAVEAYKKGDFQTTVDLLNQANALDPQPVLVYNLARAHEGLGNTDQAIEAYEKFLAQDPKASDRGAIEQRLTTLRRQRDERIAAQKARDAEQNKTNNPPPKNPPPHEEPRPEPAEPNIYPFVVGGVGVVALGVGIITGVMAKSGESAGNEAANQQRAIEERDSAQTLATISTVTFITGGILLAAGAGWFVFDTQLKKTGSQTPNRSLAPRVAIGPGFVGLSGVLP